MANKLLLSTKEQQQIPPPFDEAPVYDASIGFL
jgi:hypothetical protein